jgi:hypothetical protein
MLKKTRIYAVAIAAIGLLLSGLSPIGSSQTSPQVARNAALIAATKEVLQETSELRELAIIRPVQSSTQSRSEIERMLVKNLDEETTPAQLHAAEVTLKRLGLAPADFQYRALMMRVLTEQVAGYYEPKTGEFHLADWIDLDGQRPVMAHELTHALQDQHFNLRRFEHWPKGDSDSELAAHALIEGDATLAMALYVSRNPLRALAFLKSMGSMGATSEQLEKAPRALRETLLFPYQQGTDWAKSLYKQGGWERVSKAFTELPQSTEQIMHPDKYLAHEAPVKITLPDITKLLNSSERAAVRSVRPALAGGSTTQATWSAGMLPALSAQPKKSDSKLNHAQDARATWKRIDYDVQGEWGFYLILDEYLKAPNESRRAAAGWGGDRYAIYEGPKGEVLFASLSTWDTESDAREFFDAYVKRTERRYPGATPFGPSANDQSPTTSTSFQTSDGKFVIELRGNHVAILEGLTGAFDSRTVVKALLADSPPRN